MATEPIKSVVFDTADLTDDDIATSSTAEQRLDVVAEFVRDILADLVQAGRITEVQALMWGNACDDIVLGNPVSSVGQLLREAEELTRAAALD